VCAVLPEIEIQDKLLMESVRQRFEKMERAGSGMINGSRANATMDVQAGERVARLALHLGDLLSSEGQVFTSVSCVKLQLDAGDTQFLTWPRICEGMQH